MPAREEAVISTSSHGRSIDEVIAARFACRAFQARPVPRRSLETSSRLREVHRAAPNIQPGQVYVVTGAVKARVSEALQKAHREVAADHASEYQYYASELPEPYLARRQEFGRLFYGSLGIAQTDQDARARQTAKNYDFFGAPVGMIVTIDRRLQVGSWLDLGMFIQNILIAAEGRGLQSCPQETFSKYHRVIRPLLAIPDHEMVVCGISLGFAEDADARGLMPRAKVGDFATFAGFDAANTTEHEGQ